MGDAAGDLALRQTAPAEPGLHALVGAVLIGGLAVTQIVAMPLLAAIVAGAFDAGSAGAGLIGLGNLFGTAAGSLFVTLFLPSLRPRQTALVATVLACASQFLVGFVSTFAGAVLLEAIAGAGAGVLLALSSAIVGASANSDRGFGFILALQALVAVVVLLVLPIFSTFPGLLAVVSLLTCVQIVLVPVCFTLGVQSQAASHPSARNRGAPVSSTVWLFSIAYFAFSAAVGVIWVFSGVLGGLAGIGVEAVGHSLALGNIAAIAGSLLAAAIATRFGRLLPIICVCLILMSGVALFSSAMTHATFYVASSLYLFAWGAGLPFFMGAVAEDDPTDRVTAMLPVISFAGMGVGPALVSLVPLVSLSGQVVGTTCVFSLSAILVTVLARHFQERKSRLSSSACSGT